MKEIKTPARASDAALSLRAPSAVEAHGQFIERVKDHGHMVRGQQSATRQASAPRQSRWKCLGSVQRRWPDGCRPSRFGDDGERHAPFEHRIKAFEIRVVLQ